MISIRVGFSFVIFIATIAMSYSCSIETAKAPKEKQLIILSDYLQKSDTVFFQDFIQENNVNVEIFTMKPDNIIGLMRNQGSNVQADLILVKSLYDVHKMYKRKILQKIHFGEEVNEVTKKISSTKYNFIGLGIDPFIIANSQRKKVRTYNELGELKYINFLKEKEVISMLAPVSAKLSRVKANNWIQSFISNQVLIDTLSDSIRNLLPILTTYNTYNSINDSLLNFKDRFLTYPNARTNGTFYNVRAAAIIDQAQNYSNAKSFILFYTQAEANLKLNKQTRTLSLFEDGLPFRRYTDSPETLVQYYQTIHRVLQKIK